MKKGNVLVLVVGGSGFLGSHVADTLSDVGYRVKVFDTQQSDYLRDDQEMVIGNILDRDALIRAAKNCRYIFNFAGLSDIDDAKDRPIDTVELNVLGNVNVLEAARIAKVERFIFASSVYVYSGKGSFYRASKQASERFVEAYHERYGLNYTILRYGSLYGRRADDRNAIYRFIKEALQENKLTYRGTPDSFREYIHVTDAARLSVKALGSEFINRHLVLTGSERLQVKQCLKMIAEVLSSDVQIEFKEGNKIEGHYEMTPYSFDLKLGHKLVSNDYVDLGQGILDCLHEFHEKRHNDGE